MALVQREGFCSSTPGSCRNRTFRPELTEVPGLPDWAEESWVGVKVLPMCIRVKRVYVEYMSCWASIASICHVFEQNLDCFEKSRLIYMFQVGPNKPKSTQVFQVNPGSNTDGPSQLKSTQVSQNLVNSSMRFKATSQSPTQSSFKHPSKHSSKRSIKILSTSFQHPSSTPSSHFVNTLQIHLSARSMLTSLHAQYSPTTLLTYKRSVGIKYIVE